MLPLFLPCIIISVFHLSLLTSVNIALSILIEGTSALKIIHPDLCPSLSLPSAAVVLLSLPFLFVTSTSTFESQPVHLSVKLSEFTFSNHFTPKKSLIHILSVCTNSCRLMKPSHIWRTGANG